MVVVSLVIQAIVVNSYSLDDVTKPYTFVTRDTIKKDRVNANYDTIYGRINQLNDSLEFKFVRFVDFKDTIFDTIKARFGRIDSITASRHISTDSIIRLICISGNPIIDSIQGADRISGNPIIDSIQGADRISGNPIIDSIQGTNCITGNPVIDSISGNPWFSGNVTTDSLIVTKGVLVSTINTGLGSYEIGQNLRTTDDVIFDSVYARTFGKDTTFPCSLYTNDSLLEADVGYATIIGSSIIIRCPGMGGVPRTGEHTTIHVPSRFKTTNNSSVGVSIINNTVYAAGVLDTKTFIIYNIDYTDISSSGSGGIVACTFSYTLY